MLSIKEIKKRILILAIIALATIGGFGLTTSALAKSNPDEIDLVEDKETKEAQEETKLNYKAESKNGSSELISVKKSDENKFSPKEWEKVLQQIEAGEVFLEDENTPTLDTVENKIATYSSNDQKTESK